MTNSLFRKMLALLKGPPVVPFSLRQTWAEKEVDLYKKAQQTPTDEPDFGKYASLCAESALRAFASLLKDGHSGMSITVTHRLLSRLIDGQPLTPIDDIPDNWTDSWDHGDGVNAYQCVRMPSLFKYVLPNGTVEYSDMDSSQCVNVDTGGVYTSGLVRRVMSEISPITMPYYPPIGSTMVYCKECLFDLKNGDFDTIGILHAVQSADEKKDRHIDINRFFKEDGRQWVEISKEEYLSRVEHAASREKQHL